jgi:hypothetical protein
MASSFPSPEKVTNYQLDSCAKYKVCKRKKYHYSSQLTVDIVGVGRGSGVDENGLVMLPAEKFFLYGVFGFGWIVARHVCFLLLLSRDLLSAAIWVLISCCSGADLVIVPL